MEKDIYVAKLPGNPVLRALKISRNEAYNLTFQSAIRKNHRYSGMDGYTYSFNGRVYRDVDSLWSEQIEKIAENVQIGVDKFGEKVLRIRYSIPTFDSIDREWNSKAEEYLMFDGKNINLVTMAGGYRIAQLSFYEKLLSADIGMKPIFEKLGWPTVCIEWI